MLKLAVSQTLYTMPLWSLVPLAKLHIDNQHFHSISKDLATVRVYIFRNNPKWNIDEKRRQGLLRAFDYSFLKNIVLGDIDMQDY